MEIREAKKEDYQELIGLFNDFVGDKRYVNKGNDSFEEVLENPNNYVYVAEDKGGLVGFVTFSVRVVVRYPKPVAEIDELFVSPKHRKKGLGTKLVETVLDKASDVGCYRVFIETHYRHKGAHKLYESMEFTNYGYHFIKDL